MSARLLMVDNWQIIARQAKFKPKGMAVICAVSLRQLERHFADKFRLTPREWARDLRLTLARELIARGFSNKEVVAELFFTDSAHLCHEFKTRAGKTPRFSSAIEGGPRCG